MASSVADEVPTSGDVMVLDSTSGSRDLRPNQGEESQEQLKSQCEKAILKLCSICGSDDDGKNRRPFRVVVLGKHGAGKSSFINGVAAALSQDSWHEYAYTGYMGSGAPITIVNQRLVKCSNEETERYHNILLPTIIDVAGLMDEADVKLEELLRLLFYGHVEEERPLRKVYEDCRNHTKEEVRDLYSETYPEMRVDRVIFVASSDEVLPERLITCVHRAARPSHHREERRAVPIYGVMTKKDKVDMQSTQFLDRKKTFMQALGLIRSRFLICSNYCDDLDPEGQRSDSLRPELDLPLIRFMQRVCDRALKVVKEDEVLPGSREARQNAANAEKQKWKREGCGGELAAMWQNLEPMCQDITTAAVAGLVALFLVLPSGSQENPVLRKICDDGIIGDPTYKQVLCESQASLWWQYFRQALMFLLATLIGGVVFIYERVSRRL